MPDAVADTRLLSEVELRAWRGFLRTHACLVKTLDHELEAQHGLSLTAYEVLMHLADAPGERLRMHQIADSVLLSRSGLTRLVDRLERDELLGRCSCPSDARGAFAQLTPAGRRRVGEARATHLEGVRRHFLSVLAPGEQEALGATWERLGAELGCGGGAGCCDPEAS